MQNVVQNSTTDSVGNCVKHEVGHRANPAPPTSATSAKTSNSHCNSVPKSNNNTNKGNFKANSASLSNQIHKTVTVTELTATSSSSNTSEHSLQQIKQTRSYPRYMPDSSDSDSDDVLSESEVGDVEDCHCPSTSTPSLDAPHFLLAAAAAAQHERHIGDLQRIDPDTQARIEALLEVAGIAKLTGGDGKRLGDQEVLSRLTSSVSCALDEAAAALTRMRSENSNTIHQEERSLVEACSDGDVSAVRRLLDEGRSVHETTEEGESLLSLACSAGYYELAQVLLAMRANVEDRGVKGDCTPLMEAASAGNADIVRLLLDHGADINAQSSSGNTPLMYACAGGHEEVVSILLESGANVEDHNENGHTPLMEAASAGHVGVAKILLKHGAGINTHSNEFKESALTLACYKGHLEMVRFLLEEGADQEHKTDEMHTALMEASMDGHVEVARLLLDSGAQVNMPADSFESPLTLAACGGHVELAMLLLERGANIEEVNDEGYTPLMEAAREGHEEMVALLLSQGADINAQTEETQETALTLACCGGFAEVADFLIKAGADIELGASTPLMEAAQEGHLDLVRYLLEASANVHAQTGTGDTALTYACENGHTDVAELLLQYGAELEHASEGGRTPLMKAARAGHLCTVQFLIAKGADVNRQTTNNDHTPLSLACAGGHLAVVELLLLHGANPFHRLKDNSTMIIEASKSGHTQVVHLLLDYPNSILVSPELAQISSGMNVAPPIIAGSVTSDDTASSGVAYEVPTPAPRVPPIGVVAATSLPATSLATFGGRPEPQGATVAALNSLLPSSGSLSSHSLLTPYSTSSTSNQGVVTATTSLAAAAQKILLKKNQDAVVTSVLDTEQQPLTTAELQQTKNSPTVLSEHPNLPGALDGKLLPSRFQLPVPLGAEDLYFEKSQLVEELENIERELREKAQSSQPNSSGTQSNHTTTLSPAAAAALTHMLSLEVAELNRNSNAGGLVGLASTTPVNLEDIVKLLEELPPLEFEPRRPSPPNTSAPTPTIPSASVPFLPQQARESVIVTNPNVVSSNSISNSTATSAPSTPSSSAVSPASLPPAERPKAKAVKKENKTIKKQQQHWQVTTSNVQQQQQSQQMQQLQQLQQLNQHLQQQVMQQRHLKQQNQATLAALQQNALQNQAQLAALQQNVAQLQQLEQQVLAPAYNAGTSQGSSAAAATAQFQQCVQQILQQKQQLQQQIRQFQLQVEQQLAFPQQQLPPLATAVPSTVTRVERLDGEISADSADLSPVSKVSSAFTDDNKDEEVKSPSRAEKRPIDSTLTEESLSSVPCNTSAGLQVTGAPVPLFAAQDSPIVPTNIGVQIQNSALSNGSTSCGSGLPYPSLPGPTVPLSCASYPAHNVQVTNGALIHYQQLPTTATSLQSASVPVPVSVSGLQVVTSQASSLAMHQQLLIQSRQMLQGQALSMFDTSIATTSTGTTLSSTVASNALAFNVGAFTVPQVPPPAVEQQQSSTQQSGVASPSFTEKKGKSGKKSKVTPQPPKQLYNNPVTDSSGNAPAISTSGIAAHPPVVGTSGSLGLTPAMNPGVGINTVNGTTSTAPVQFDPDFTDYSSYLSTPIPSSTTPVSGAASGPPFPTGATSVSAPAASAVTTGATGQYNQPLLPMLDLDSETDSNHDTALTLACTGGHEELVELLLSRGADIEHRDKKGFTPLILAATAGHEKVVEVLLNHGANIEAQSERTKDTALSLACSGGRYEVVEFLLNRGANKEHRNVSDYTPLSLAASGGYVNIIRLLLAHAAEINSRTGSKLGISPLMLAAMNGHVAAVRTLLEMGSDINAQIETNRNTALTLACFQGRHEVVQLLLEKKANVEHRAKTGLTPLMEAASGGYVEVGRVLLDYGADVNAPPVPSSRDTALTIASDKGHVEFVELLLQRGAQADVKNKKGNSPLWLAANGGHLEVVELLHKAGADIDSQDNRKVSCLMAAFRKGHVKVVKWMVKKVTQFPSDQEMTRFISTTLDKDLLKKCHTCMDIIRAAKDHQAAEANKNAANLLDELDMEKIREDLKRAAAARKREKKKRKKQEKREEKRRLESEHEQSGDQENEAQDEDICNGKEDKELENEDDVRSDPGGDFLEYSEPLRSHRALNKLSNNNREVDEKQLLKDAAPKKKKASMKIVDSKNEDADICSSKRKDSIASTSSNGQNNPIKQSPSAVISDQTSVICSANLTSSNTNTGTKGGKKKKENSSIDTIATDKQAKSSTAKNNILDGFTILDTLKEVSNSAATLKSPTTITSPKRPPKREEGWKEVVRRGPVNSRENAGLNVGSTSTTGTKKSQNIEKSSATLSVLQSSERSKKVSVPSNAISRVIGRAGCNINAIREISGAHIEIEKQGKGQGDRTVLIKGTAESIRQAQQLITALIKEPEKEFAELMAKFRAANASIIGGTSTGNQSIKTVTSTGGVKISGSTTAVSSSLTTQHKITRAATTIASTKSIQTSSGTGHVSSVPSTVAWGVSSTLQCSPKRSISQVGSKTPPVVQATSQQIPKSGAVRQLFPECSTAIKKVATSQVVVTSSIKPAVSYTLANSATTQTSAVAARTTPVISIASPIPAKPVPHVGHPISQSFAAKVTEKKNTVPNSPSSPASHNQHLQQVASQNQQSSMSQPAGQVTQNQGASTANPPSSSALSRPPSTSPVQEYSPFNNLFSKVAQQTMWAKDQQGGIPKASKGMNFASVAAAGVTTGSAKMTSSISNVLTCAPPIDGLPLQVDASKAPGYRGNVSSNCHSQEVSSMDISTSLTSSAPGTPIPSAGPIRPPGGGRIHPLTPPPRIGTPPLFNPTPLQPLGPVGARHQTVQSSPSESISVPPPPTASLAPGGPSAVRMRPRLHEQQQFENLPFPGLHGLRQPGSDNLRPGPSFPLSHGPRYNPSTMPAFQSKLNPNAPDFSVRGNTQQGFPAPVFGSGACGNRISFPPVGYGLTSAGIPTGVPGMGLPSSASEMKLAQNPGIPGQNFGPDYPPPIGAQFTNTEMQRILGYPGPVCVANRISGPPPPTQQGLLCAATLSQPPSNSPLISPRATMNPDNQGSVSQNQDNYGAAANQNHRSVEERKLPRPIGTERAHARRTPGPLQSGNSQPVFSQGDLGLWSFGAPTADMGNPVPQLPTMNPPIPPGLTHSDWLTVAGLHPSVAGPTQNTVADETSLLYLQKQGVPHPHHHHHHPILQRQLEGITEGAAESLEMQLSQNTAGINGAAPSNVPPYHPAGFLNGLPPPVMPGAIFAGVSTNTSGEAIDGTVNGMWVGPAASLTANMKGKVSGPSSNTVSGDQQLNESALMWVKWSQQ